MRDASVPFAVKRVAGTRSRCCARDILATCGSEGAGRVLGLASRAAKMEKEMVEMKR